MAVKYGANTPVDIVYTVATMRRLNGFEMMRLLRGFHEETSFHIIADNEAEKTEAMRLMASSCILRPISTEALRRAAENR